MQKSPFQAKAVESLKHDGRWYRIKAEESKRHLGALPEREWVTMSSSELVQRVGPTLQARVPLNDELVANLRKEPVRNPILCGPDWWPYVGSQRCRALLHLWDYERYETPVLILHLKKDTLSIWQLWGGNEGKRCQAIMVQLYELIFKSMYYPASTTVDGKPMFEFERDGDKMYWSVRDDNPAWKDFGKEARKKINSGTAGDVKKWERSD
jgi:hypothetical protein